MQLSHIIFALAAVATSTQAAAIENENHLSKRGCQITLCKGAGKKDCVKALDPQSDCEAVHSSDGRPFISGFASPGCRCEVYEHADCSYILPGHQWEYVDETGWSDWHFGAKGVRCQ